MAMQLPFINFPIPSYLRFTPKSENLYLWKNQLLSLQCPRSHQVYFSGQDWGYEQTCSFLFSESLSVLAACTEDLDGYVTELRVSLNSEFTDLN